MITLEFSGRHDKDSHKGIGSGRITDTQEKALEAVVRTFPQCRAKAVRRATQNMAEDQKIPPEMMNSVRKNVRAVKKQYYVEKLGMEMKGTYQDLEGFAKSRNIAQAVRAHNDAKVPMVCMTFSF